MTAAERGRGMMMLIKGGHLAGVLHAGIHDASAAYQQHNGSAAHLCRGRVTHIAECVTTLCLAVSTIHILVEAIVAVL